MEHLIIPKDYHSELNLHDTQIAIKTVKDFFAAVKPVRGSTLYTGLTAAKKVPRFSTAFC